MRAMMVALVGVLVATGSAAAQSSGQQIFEGKGNCHACHGKNAKGGPLAPDLTDGEWLNIDGTLAAIQNLVRTGVARPKRYPAPMPPMGGASLTSAELAAVAAYVKGLSPSDSTAYAPRPASRGARRSSSGS